MIYNFYWFNLEDKIVQDWDYHLGYNHNNNNNNNLQT